VHSADGWRAVLEPVIARYRGITKRPYFRRDAAFANPEMYEFLEAEGIGYTIRLPANRVLQDSIGYLLKRRSGDRRMRCAATTPVSAIRRGSGTSRAVSRPKSSGIPASCTRVSALS
jgi:Transposase DDE domain group 1